MTVVVDYTLAGTLAQLARGAIVDDIARRMVTEFAARLEARLAPADDIVGPVASRPAGAISLPRLLLAGLWQRLRAAFGRFVRLS